MPSTKFSRGEIMRKILILIIMSLFSFVSIGNADVNFAGKTVTWVVPFKEGGGTSRFARFIQPFLKKYLPGNPDVQITVSYTHLTLPTILLV